MRPAHDMRRGMQGLALTVQEQLKRNPHAGDLYIFRGDAATWPRFCGMTASGCRFTPCVGPRQVHLASASDGAVSISAAQMAYMLEGIDCETHN